MLNTRDLERRWLRYKIKSYIPHAVITLSTAVIASVITIYLISDHNTIILKKEKNISMPTIESVVATKFEPVIPEKKEIIEQPKITPSAPVISKTTLKPSMDFMKKMQESSDGYYKRTPTEHTFNTTYATKPPKKKEVTQTKKKTTVAPVEISVEESKIEESDDKKLLITRQNSLQDIKNAEERFKKNNSPALSLFLSKQYYALGDYRKAYNYALMTNQLDKTNEDSWIIFSKSLVKLGKIELAKKALNEYIKFSHSNNAALLLEDITTGKFQ